MIWIGCSGWVYKHWRGCFYPWDLKQRDWLGYYARHFPTVEINRSFYRLPRRENFESWAAQTWFRSPFCFATKANRYLTHWKKLYGPEDPLARLMGAAAGLGDRAGPFLYQLPPGWPADPVRLRYFIGCLPHHYRAAFEFRDPSWYSPEILQILNETGCALVRAIGGHYTPMEVPDAGWFSYLRVHGGQWGVGLTDGELSYWAERIAASAATGRDLYIYFNNDPDCHAIRNAFRLREMLAGAPGLVM